MEAEALCGLAWVALDLGDAATARQRALRALGLAGELGLGLRQTAALLILGKATVMAGDRNLGGAYLRQAARLARTQQFSLRMRDAEEALQKSGLGEASDPLEEAAAWGTTSPTAPHHGDEGRPEHHQ